MKLIAILFPLLFSSKMGQKLLCTVSPSSSSSESAVDDTVVADSADDNSCADESVPSSSLLSLAERIMDGIDGETSAAQHINLLLIRHGRSLGNEMMDQPGNQWGDPYFRDDANLIDSPLSPRGIEQAVALGQSCSQEDLDRIQLVIVSPLTRALQTMQLAVLPRLPSHVPIIVHPWSAERVLYRI
jgi:hypothetical protein